MTPDRMNVIVKVGNAEEYNGQKVRMEKWCLTKYVVADFDRDWIENLMKPGYNYAQIHLPELNRYLQKDFGMVRKFAKYGEITNLIESKSGNLYFAQDLVHNMPKAYIYAWLRTKKTNHHP